MCVSRRHAVRWMGCPSLVPAQTQFRFSFFPSMCARQRQWSRSCEHIQSLLSGQRRELIQPLLSEYRWLRRCNDGKQGKCALGWSGNDAKREERALAGLPAAAHVSSLGSTMTGPACSFPSSSDAPVCASLVRDASAKSSPLLHARTDNPLHSDRPDGHPRDLPPHRRLSSMSPARFRPAPRLLVDITGCAQSAWLAMLASAHAREA